MKGRRVAILGFLEDGATARIVQILVHSGSEVVVNSAPDTVDVVIVGMDGADLLERVAFVRDTGYRGPVIGVGRLTAPQRRRWGRMHDTRNLGLDADGLYQTQTRQVLINADPASIDADTLLVALEVGDGAEVVEVAATSVRGVRSSMEILASEIERMRRWASAPSAALRSHAEGDGL